MGARKTGLSNLNFNHIAFNPYWWTALANDNTQCKQPVANDSGFEYDPLPSPFLTTLSSAMVVVVVTMAVCYEYNHWLKLLANTLWSKFKFDKPVFQESIGQTELSTYKLYFQTKLNHQLTILSSSPETELLNDNSVSKYKRNYELIIQFFSWLSSLSAEMNYKQINSVSD